MKIVIVNNRYRLGAIIIMLGFVLFFAVVPYFLWGDEIRVKYGLKEFGAIQGYGVVIGASLVVVLNGLVKFLKRLWVNP
jgi:hypothetical protein